MLLPMATNLNVEDDVIVQGIVDLCLVNKDGLVIIDYKTGSLGNHNIEKYKAQVEMYASAMERAFRMPVNKKYLASIKTGELINL